MRVAGCFPVIGILILGLALGMTCKKKNQPPGAPSIPSGPTSGRKGDSLRFSTTAEDQDGDSVAVRFDWGDSTMSDWSAPVRSGDSVVMKHAWQKLATYSIGTQARDAGETASVWSAEHQLTIASFSATFGGSGDEAGLSVQMTPDGGYIVVGRTSSYGAGLDDAWLLRTDRSGSMMWDKTFGGACGDYGYSVEQTTDGGYIIAGSTYSQGAGRSDVWLVKADVSGDEVWEKTFGGSAWDVCWSVQQTSDEGFIVVGVTSVSGRGDDIWLVKTDALGDRIWDRTFGGSGEDRGYSVRQTSDGGYIITGYTASYGAGYFDIWLIKTDDSGNIVWDRTFGGADDDCGESVRQTSDGGYVIAGSTGHTPDGLGDVWLVKTDASGNEVWDKTFGGVSQEGGHSVEQTSDGGYIIVGYADGRTTAWLIRTDASGNKIWDKTFGGAHFQEGNSVQQTSDGGYVITGYTYSPGVGLADAWLVKTDAEGN